MTKNEQSELANGWTPELREQATFQVYELTGRAPEEVDPKDSARYREYLSTCGVTDEQLAQRRQYSYLALRAWEKDDCFDLPDPESDYGKRIKAEAEEAIERLIREGRIPRLPDKS